MRTLTVKDLADLDIESDAEAKEYDEALVDLLNASIRLANDRAGRSPDGSVCGVGNPPWAGSKCLGRPVTDVVPKSTPDLSALLRELARNFRGEK